MSLKKKVKGYFKKRNRLIGNVYYEDIRDLLV